MVLLTIRFYIHRQILFHRRHDDLLLILIQLSIAGHERGKIDVGDVAMFDRNINQFHISRDVDDLVTVQIIPFHRKKDVTIVGRRADHHRRGLADADRFSIHDDLHAAAAVAQK